MLEARGLTKIYGRRENKVVAVNQISLKMEKGSLTAVRGKSGSGKTTLLHMLGGLMKPDEGGVFFEEQDIYGLSDTKLSEIRRNHISVIFQAFHLIPNMTAKENILLPSKLDKRKEDKEWFDELVSLLGIQDRLKHLPGELSGGQQQRTAIARTLMNKPEFVLCDEPTGNLDEQSGREVMDLLLNINRKYGTAIMVVTHDKEIASCLDTQIFMKDGSLEAEKITFF